jgi:hypothetical protein
MDDTESPTVPIEEYAIPARIPLNDPFPCSVRLERRHEQIAVKSVPPYLVYPYEFHDLRLRRHAPTLAARPRMAALVSGVDVQAERGHCGIISRQARQRKSRKTPALLLQT